MTIEQACELMDITPRHWSRLEKDGIAHKTKSGEPDFPRSNAAYIRYLRDGTNASVKDLRQRKLRAETEQAEADRAEQAERLVPVELYRNDCTEFRDKLCIVVSRMKDVTPEKVIEAIKSVELAPVEFTQEDKCLSK